MFGADYGLAQKIGGTSRNLALTESLHERLCYNPDKEETMAHKFSEGERVRVREDAELQNGVKPYRGRTGTVREEVESSAEMVFYDVEFGGSWDRRYVREDALELVEGE